MPTKIDKINRTAVFLWFVVIGSNIAIAYSQLIALQGPIIFAGTAYFSFVYRRHLLRLLRAPEFLLGMAILATPVVLTLLKRFFDLATVSSTARSGTFFASVMLVFFVSTLISFPFDSRRIIVRACFAIVAVTSACNLYELFVQNNVWSSSPGRSAGFYFNPNVSAEALVGYGLVVLLGRSGKLTLADSTIILMVTLGVFATFSRSGILLAMMFLAAAIVARTEPRHMVRVVFFAAAGAMLVVSFVWFVVQNMDLSGDAALRIVSLIERGGLGDYREDRGEVALAALDLVWEEPILGVGLGTIFEMPVGPHNMFVAMFVDLGIFGLLAYVLLLVRLMVVASLAGRDLSGLLWTLAWWHLGFSFVSHNLLSDAETIPLLGIAVALASQISTVKRAGLLPG